MTTSHIRLRRLILGAVLVMGPLLFAVPANAAISLTLSDGSISSWTLAPSGANTKSAGTFTVNSTGAYTVTLTADRTRMTEHDGSAYVSGGKTLGAALSVISARSGGTAPVPGLGATATVGSSTTLATGTGLGTDIFGITLSQTTAITDPMLAGGRTYHIVLTYTASAIV